MRVHLPPALLHMVLSAGIEYKYNYGIFDMVPGGHMTMYVKKYITDTHTPIGTSIIGCVLCTWIETS